MEAFSEWPKLECLSVGLRSLPGGCGADSSRARTLLGWPMPVPRLSACVSRRGRFCWFLHFSAYFVTHHFYFRSLLLWVFFSSQSPRGEVCFCFLHLWLYHCLRSGDILKVPLRAALTRLPPPAWSLSLIKEMLSAPKGWTSVLARAAASRPGLCFLRGPLAVSLMGGASVPLGGRDLLRLWGLEERRLWTSVLGSDPGSRFTCVLDKSLDVSEPQLPIHIGVTAPTSQVCGAEERTPTPVLKNRLSCSHPQNHC